MPLITSPRVCATLNNILLDLLRGGWYSTPQVLLPLLDVELDRLPSMH